jgi:ABC-2 type transport system ATP-binding protein
VIEVTNVSKSYGAVEALREVSFSISKNEIVGILGPNGAGKTTIIKVLTGYLHPDHGSAKVNGMDVLTHSQEVKNLIGYLPETAPLYPELNVQSYLRMMADMHNIHVDDMVSRISEAVHAVGLEEYLTRPIGHLSKGYRQRVGLAQAILHKPNVLILDEPTIGLDPTQIIEIRRLIRKFSKQSTILFSSHILPEVEALCDRAIILMNGEVKADARLRDLAKTANTILVLEEDAEIEGDIHKLEGINHVDRFTTIDGYPAFRISTDLERDMNLAIFKLAGENNWPLRELRQDIRTLETVFNELALAA